MKNDRSLKTGTDVLYIGMALIDSIVKEFDPTPVSASGYRAASGSLHAGGEAVNGAIAAAKLGISSAILCALGQDDAGDIVVNTLKKNGVDTSPVLRITDRQTPVTTMLVEADGSRKSITNLSHKYNFHPERYTEALQGRKIVILGSLFRAPFDDAEIIKKVVTAAKETGALVFADTKIPNFKKLSLNDIADSLPYIDYIFPNEDEARYFADIQENRITDQESFFREKGKMAEVFLDFGVKNVIIKLGAKGSLFKNKEELILTEGFKIDAVDATGAGDNFIAGFAAEILSGKDHETALRFANACGALCTTKEGAHDGLTGREQAESLLNIKKNLVDR